MAKLIQICTRSTEIKGFETKVKTLFNRLLPSDISPRPPLIRSSDHLYIGILNPSPTLTFSGDSVCLGKMFAASDGWAIPGNETPDGNFALFRNTHTKTEVITDILGSRTVWYYFDEERLIVSTSQRCIVYFLESFEPNPEVYSWFISSGTLGPELSWDRRIRYLPGNSRLKLDRLNWKLEIETTPVNFTLGDYREADIPEIYENALRETLGNIHLNHDHWSLLLSGGYDSRGLCYFLPFTQDMKGISWGKPSSIRAKNTDPFIAAQIAQKQGIDFRFLPIKNSAGHFEEMISRFLINGEGRSDKISGYMDLFATWKSIFESNVYGLIRGDHTFDYRPSANAFETRYNYYLLTLNDYTGLKDWGKFNLPDQVIPEKFVQLRTESFAEWGGRLDRMFYFPMIQAALADLKLGYVEKTNPYINRRLMDIQGSLPVNAHLGKAVFKDIIRKKYPEIPFATTQALTTEENFTTQPKVARYICENLRNPDSTSVFSSQMKNLIADSITQSLEKSSFDFFQKIKKTLKKRIPNSLKKSIKKPFYKTEPDFPLIGFRIVLIEKMHQLLCEDARY
ncbi:MAG: hypothetical protein SF052_01910 [Bacteroidia bacterium]|nr:hypothetical protein [Bacteroidia bacterium]